MSWGKIVIVVVFVWTVGLYCAVEVLFLSERERSRAAAVMFAFLWPIWFVRGAFRVMVQGARELWRER